ncbi:MAG: PhoH family protein, partial [Clostridioides difficile]
MKIIVIKIVIIVKIIIAITTNKIKLKILGGLIQLIIQKKFTIADGNFERELFGNFDENVKLIEKTLNIDVILREGNIILIGEEKNVDSALKLMNELHQTVSNGKHLDKQSISYSLSLLLEGSEQKIKELEGTIVITQRGKAVQPKTLGQKEYIKLIENNDITFGVGPAGTGKTYLAVAMAVKAFKRDEVSRIILTRPAVEAGESLGFLPGDLKDKVDPYLRPLYDALFEMLGADKFNKYLERGTIEVAPLAFMRGRTLD